jgi:hypothetical protein
MHVFPNPHGYPQVKKLKIKNCEASILGGNRAVGQHFDGGHLAIGVLTLPGHLNKFSSMGRRTRLTSVLCGRSGTTQRAYVALRRGVGGANHVGCTALSMCLHARQDSICEHTELSGRDV